MFSKFSIIVAKISAAVSMVLVLMLVSQQAAVAADQCTTNNSSTTNTVLSIGVIGAALASQTLNAVLVTEGNIGVMADRILLTQLQIGAMANRIVYVTQFSQTNTINGIYQFLNPVYLGKENGQYKYSGTLLQIPSRPFGW